MSEKNEAKFEQTSFIIFAIVLSAVAIMALIILLMLTIKVVQWAL